MSRLNLLDVVELLEMIITYFPNFKIKDLETTAEAWHLILQHGDKQKVMSNLLTHIMTSHFPPTVADLLNPPSNEHENGRRAIPNAQETMLMLEEYENRKVATPEEREQGLAKIAEIPWIKEHKNNA